MCDGEEHAKPPRVSGVSNAEESGVCQWRPKEKQDTGLDRKYTSFREGAARLSEGESPMAESSTEGPVVRTLTALFGLFAGLASLIYIGGGLVVFLRLHYQGFPAPLDVASRLAREVLMSVGLSQIVAPMLLLAVLYVGYRFLRGAAPIHQIPVLYGQSGTPWRDRLVLFIVSLGAGGLLTLPGVAAWLITRPRDLPFLFILFSVASSGFVVLVVIHVREVLIRRHPEPASFNALRTVVIFSALWALALFPGCVIFGSAVRMQPVRVCGEGNAYNLPGYLIGETNERVYVGEQRENDRRILAIPWDGTAAVFIGSPNIPELCARVLPTPTAPPFSKEG